MNSGCRGHFPQALAAAALTALALASAAAPAKPARAVDINHASAAQLRTLPGVDPAVAARIIAGRPYRSKADLVERGVLTQGAFVALRHRIQVVPGRQARPAGAR